MNNDAWIVPEVTLNADEEGRYAAMTVIVPVEVGVALLGKSFSVSITNLEDFDDGDD